MVLAMHEHTGCVAVEGRAQVRVAARIGTVDVCWWVDATVKTGAVVVIRLAQCIVAARVGPAVGSRSWCGEATHFPSLGGGRSALGLALLRFYSLLLCAFSLPVSHFLVVCFYSETLCRFSARPMHYL